MFSFSVPPRVFPSNVLMTEGRGGGSSYVPQAGSLVKFHRGDPDMDSNSYSGSGVWPCFGMNSYKSSCKSSPNFSQDFLQDLLQDYDYE